MKIKIGQLEITDVSMDELQALVARFGGSVEQGGNGGPAGADGSGKPNGGNGTIPERPSDRVVLERLVKAGTAGAPTQEVGEVLGFRGKSIKRGLLSWARRIGLVQDDGIDPFEDCRADGTRRGVRLKASLVPVAQKLLENK